MFTQKDLQLIQQKGIHISTIENQIEDFKTGFPFSDISSAATAGDGLRILENNELSYFIKKYENSLKFKKVVKFVPASGAASRMFKNLFTFAEKYDGTDKLFEDKTFNSVFNFFDHIKEFAFYEDLNKIIDIEENKTKNPAKIIEALLNPSGLNYGNLPKALLKFHKYAEKTRTPIEEHLIEGINYGNSNGTVSLHFTVSPEHKENFIKLISEIQPEYEKTFGVKFNIEYSEQKPSTDTIAVDSENNPFRDSKGNLLFRPGGHGALIENLNEIDADLVFIKNIDNVVPDNLKADTYSYKKAIAGLLLEIQDKICDYYMKLSVSENQKLLDEVELFFKSELNFIPSPEYDNMNPFQKKEYLISKLNRPVRVCGMVKNEGEPGGGPFFTVNSEGETSIQIVESAQIDLKDKQKAQILENATHFNPVDLVVGFKNCKAERFDLRKFIDENTGFISSKSQEGRELKAMELPGLWNGAMANWNTVFVEVPISTFNPVKVVNDLLRDQHK